MLKLTGNPRSAGEVLNLTAQRLIRYGCTEREAHALAQVITIEPDATDTEVEAVVIEALVSAKQADDGTADIEYVGGQRRDTLRLGSYARGEAR